jgi:cell division protein FtsL
MRKPKNKKISLFNLLVMLFVSAGTIVFFVYNIITVNSLAVDINNVRSEISKNVTLNNTLQTEIERLSSYDNIKDVAADKLQLKFSQNKPKKVSINKTELELKQ